MNLWLFSHPDVITRLFFCGTQNWEFLNFHAQKKQQQQHKFTFKYHSDLRMIFHDFWSQPTALCESQTVNLSLPNILQRPVNGLS